MLSSLRPPIPRTLPMPIKLTVVILSSSAPTLTVAITGDTGLSSASAIVADDPDTLAR